MISIATKTHLTIIVSKKGRRKKALEFMIGAFRESSINPGPLVSIPEPELSN